MIYLKEIIWFRMLLQKNNNQKDHGRYSMGRNHTIYQDMIYGYFIFKKKINQKLLSIDQIFWEIVK